MDVVTAGTILNALEKAGRWEDALDWFESTRTESNGAMQPNIITFSIALRCCASNVGRAAALLEEMRCRQLSPNAFSYSSALVACRRAADWRRALAFLEEAKEDRNNFDEYVVNAAMDACSQASAWEASLHLFHGMADLSLQPSDASWNIAVGACERGQAWEASLAITKAMVDGKGLKHNKKNFRRSPRPPK